MEEHFYLLCAGGAWFLRRMARQTGQNPFQAIPLLFALVAVLCLVIRLVSNHVFPVGRVRLLFFGTHIRIDSLFFGVLLSYLWHFYFSVKQQEFMDRWRWGFFSLGVALLVPMFFRDPFAPGAAWIRIYGFVLCYLGGGALLVAFLKIFDHAKSRFARFLGYLGANSYSVYLWHVWGVFLASLILAPANLSPSAWIAYGLIAHTLSWVIGVTAARLVEIPVLKLRDRLFPSRSTRLLAGKPSE